MSVACNYDLYIKLLLYKLLHKLFKKLLYKLFKLLFRKFLKLWKKNETTCRWWISVIWSELTTEAY